MARILKFRSALSGMKPRGGFYAIEAGEVFLWPNETECERLIERDIARAVGDQELAEFRSAGGQVREHPFLPSK
jgi:hypothetical protein